MKAVLLLLLLTNLIYSFDKISVGVGKTLDNQVYNISFQKDLDYILIKDTKSILEVSIDNVKDSSSDLSIISTQAIIEFKLNNKLFSEVGGGIAYFSDTKFEDRRFGINFQFKASLGLLYKYSDNISSSLRYIHYSNAYLDEHNNGLNIAMLSFVYKF